MGRIVLRDIHFSMRKKFMNVFRDVILGNDFFMMMYSDKSCPKELIIKNLIGDPFLH